jgi:hypothetical protein
MISAQIQLTDQDARSTASSRGSAKLGQLASTADGRQYAYGTAGAVALSAGKLNISSPLVANHITRTAAATAAGSTSVAVAVGATAVTADQYAGGFLAVDVGPGQNLYLIVGNTSAGSSGTTTVTLAEPLTVALTTSSKLSLYPNTYANLIVSSSAVAFQAAGVANVDVAAANYAWFQVNGYCAVLSDGAITKGAGAIISDAVAGAVEIEVAATVTQRIGFAPELTVDTAYKPIFLTLR